MIWQQHRRLMGGETWIDRIDSLIISNLFTSVGDPS